MLSLRALLLITLFLATSIPAQAGQYPKSGDSILISTHRTDSDLNRYTVSRIPFKSLAAAP